MPGSVVPHPGTERGRKIEAIHVEMAGIRCEQASHMECLLVVMNNLGPSPEGTIVNS